ncbi:MAG TPA: DUF1134 domain-containing protein [Stenotrophobium sp.]|nr:DUF1134 domain-containing protein [Stenotrophobium sp.]
MRVYLVAMLCAGLAACAGQTVDADHDSASGASRAASVQPAATAGSGDPAQDRNLGDETYNQDEVIKAANTFFGENTKGLALAVEKAFSDFGQPVGYIVGEEGSGAAVVGLRYGHGTFTYKGGESLLVYWQGPSVGWDFGGNASKVFTLVYNLRSTYDLFQRFPAVDGSLYIVAGLGMNYQRSGDIVLAPIRTGVGLRAGASLGYVNYTRKPTVNPF